MRPDLCTAAVAHGLSIDQRPPPWISLPAPHTQNSGHSPSPSLNSPSRVKNHPYDGQYQLTKVIGPRTLNTGYTIDGLGNQTKLISPDTASAGSNGPHLGGPRQHHRGLAV